MEHQIMNIEPPDPERRAFLKFLIGFLNGLAFLALSIPGVSYVLTPLFKKQAGNWIEIGHQQDFPVGRISRAEFQYLSQTGYTSERRKGFVWLDRRAEDQFIVFSPRCTHMGCNVAWNGGSDRFECPCHGGMYDREGNVIAGPPPRPLVRLPIRLQKDRIYVQLTEA